jgi:hypothetical protein
MPQQISTPSTHLTIPQTAAMLGLTYQRAYNLALRGDLELERLPTGRLGIALASVLAYLERRGEGAASCSK